MILYQDPYLLVVNKPAGINTHKPDPLAPDGWHEWLSRRFGQLAIIHRLDKDTSGVMVFGRNRSANQSLSRQFEQREVIKEYLLLSRQRPTRRQFCARSPQARTEFEWLQAHGEYSLIAARPTTGKTHQIRRHAATNGFPILGDTRYGGEPAPRLMLHAHRLRLRHPQDDRWMTFTAPVPAAFDELTPLAAAREYRQWLDPAETNCWRLIDDAPDGFPGVIVDSYDGRLLVQWQTDQVDPSLYEQFDEPVVYEQVCTRQQRTTPRPVRGTTEDRFPVRENGLTYLAGFGAGLSTGLFMDQRENRWRLLQKDLTGRRVLNTFAYTCAFSVAAARAGAVTTSVDLSRTYLDWGRDNLRANQIDPAAHEFLAGDVFDWFRRFQRAGRQWDLVIVDPPTFSTTKKGRAFQAQRDYRALAAQAVDLVAPDGWLFCSTNQRSLAPAVFEKILLAAATEKDRAIRETEFVTLPFDFRVAEGQRPYLKTMWLRLA